MSANDDGGPAFPHTVEYSDGLSGGRLPYGGMSLRDWFAGQALAGEFASQDTDSGVWMEKGFGTVAARCYNVADAMLAARATRRDGAKE